MYAAEIDGRALTFEVASVWRRNMLIRDHQTRSIWQQATGECLAGPLKGRAMEILGGDLCTWAAWRRDHPRSQVVLEPEVWTGIVPRAFIMRMLERATSRVLAPGLVRADHRLALTADVAGISVRGEAKAYPVDLLRVGGPVVDRLAGETVTVTYDAAANRVQAFLGEPSPQGGRGKPLRVDRQYWAGWVEFHPGTSVYTAAA